MEINFLSDTYRMHKKTDLLSHSWDYAKNDYSVKIDGFLNTFSEKQFDVSISASSRDAYKSAVKQLNDAFDYDVRSCVPGKLYIGDYYLQCYMIDSGIDVFNWHKNAVVKSYKLVAESGLWVKETDKSFIYDDQEDVNGRGYPYGYAYDYSYGKGYRDLLTNGCIVPCDFILTIDGFVKNPAITINGYMYRINEVIQSHETVTIDSRAKTILLTKSNGIKVNLFSKRDRANYIFKKIPPGENKVYWNSAFEWRIKLFDKRGEPIWT